MNYVKQNPGKLDEALKNRGKEQVEQQLLAADKEYRALLTKLQNIMEERNAISEAFCVAKASGLDVSDLAAKMEVLKKEMASVSAETEIAKEAFLSILHALPNIPSSECPIGVDESANEEVRRLGTKREFDFEPLQHNDIGERLGMMDFARSVRIAGSRFVFLFAEIARLERALAQFMLNIHTNENGYTEVYTPLLLGADAMFGVGQLPKFEDDLFKTTVGSYLIPTAEASLTNIHNGEILSEARLPLRYTAYTPCFRSEAGATGRDTAGMLRQHQFGKVELVSITTPGQAVDEHERMTACAEGILRRLELPFRTVVLSTGDMGFSSEKTYDIEVWLPGQGKYREISSCSRCGGFQARRMNLRYKNGETKKNEFVHTLNGSGLAVGRCLIAILENYQQKDGSIKIPDVLVSHFGGDTIKGAE
ncbi:MAG: serine--tRNA ligase [Holosporales bacterium]|nr:serine--tRNA ligase [Holosporales bacterium]